MLLITNQYIHIRIKRTFQLHLDSIDTTLPLNNSMLSEDIEARFTPNYPTTKIQHKEIPCKLSSFNITALSQIQDHTNTRILTFKEFQDKYHTKYKNTLLQTTIVFPPQTHHIPHPICTTTTQPLGISISYISTFQLTYKK